MYRCTYTNHAYNTYVLLITLSISILGMSVRRENSCSRVWLGEGEKKEKALLLDTMSVLGVMSAATLDKVGLGNLVFDMGVLVVEIELLSGMGLF